MNLLPKKEIDLQKSSERKMEIDQGASLAKKVDALRELAAKEQQNLIRFRNESLGKVQVEIAELLAERDGISRDIESLRSDRTKLSKPLKGEWIEVRKANSQLDSLNEAMAQKSKALELKERELSEANEEISRIGRQVREKSGQIEKILSDVDLERQNLQRYVSESEGKVLKKHDELTQRTHEMDSREATLASREREVEIAQRHLDMETKDIINQRILLADREGQLERELLRQKNK